MPDWKSRYEGVETLTLAVMGCVVNGPGESKAANIGISLPGTGEAPNCPVFIDGEHATTLRGTYDELDEGFRALVDNYVASPAHARRKGRVLPPDCSVACSVISRTLRCNVKYTIAHSHHHARRFRNPISSKMCRNSQASHAIGPEKRRPPMSAIADPRPMIAMLPVSR